MEARENDWRTGAYKVQSAIEWHAKRLGVAVDYKTARAAGRKIAREQGYRAITAAEASALALDWIANNTVCPEE